MTPRRIAYVVRIFPKLSETFITHELAELRRRNIEIRIFSLRRPTEELRHSVFEKARLGESTVYDRNQFLTILRDFQPDLIHAHFATRATAVAQKIAAEVKVPFTFTAHRYDIYDKPPVDFSRRAAAARAVVTVSDANRRYIIRNFGVAPEKIHVIPCGVDTERFSPNGTTNGSPLLVCVARLALCKNLGLLLDACARLSARGLEFRCVLVGDGPCREELEARRLKLGLTSQVQLVGPAEQDEVLAWWRKATVAVLSSKSEGMPVSLMEAGACNIPAVAPAVGGIPELIADGETGLLTPPDNAEALADALQTLTQNPELARQFGAAARRRVELHFSLTRQVDSLLSLWSECLREDA